MEHMKKKILRKSSFYFALLLLIFYSCINKKDKSYSDVLYEIRTLKQNVLMKGDTLSYNKLYNYYEYDNKLDELLTVSIVMANRYNNSKAQYRTFDILLNNMYDTRKEKYVWDKTSLEMTFLYLKKAVILGNNDAINSLKFHIANYNDELTWMIKDDIQLSDCSKKDN